MVSTERSNVPNDIHPDTLSLASLLGELAQFPDVALTLEGICDRILEKMLNFVPCEGCWILTPNRFDDNLELRAWRGIKPNSASDLRWITNNRGATDIFRKQALRDFCIDDAPTDLVWPGKRIGRIALSSMLSQDGYVGSIVLFFRDKLALTPRHRILITSLASQAGLVIRSVDLFLASQELVLQRERNCIAREIHDGVSQNLALLMLKMEIISRLSESNPKRMKSELQKVMGILESSVSELRRSIYTLRSPGLDGLGLLPAIKRLTREFTKQTSIDIDLTLPVALSLPPDAQSTLFSIVKERLDIVAKSGHRSRVSLEIDTNNEEGISVSLTDTGTNESDQNSNLNNAVLTWERRIGDRVRHLGGVVTIHNYPTHTTLRITIPLR